MAPPVPSQAQVPEDRLIVLKTMDSCFFGGIVTKLKNGPTFHGGDARVVFLPEPGWVGPTPGPCAAAIPPKTRPTPPPGGTRRGSTAPGGPMRGRACRPWTSPSRWSGGVWPVPERAC